MVSTFSEESPDPLLTRGHYEVTVTEHSGLVSQCHFGEDVTPGLRRYLVHDWLQHLQSFHLATPDDQQPGPVSGLLVRTEFLTASSIERRQEGLGPFLALADVIEWAINDLNQHVDP